MENDKRTYYVSVQAGSIMENKGDTAFEFEISATEDDVADLQERFDMLSDLDNSSAFRAILPAVPYHQDSALDGYDYTLTDIYRKLYDLGNEETRQTIAGMDAIGEQEPPIT
ncbi:hydrolase [Paenibacillus hodogayensis]|uniref:Hydrolase n=1 Tax=Paenibacillus hodogayensis TaxID=279208 RepID=A0ABV5VQP5_9BACL